MKLLFMLMSFMGISISIYAQTNTFPTSGNVGIGITNPSSPLHIIGGSNMTSGWNKTMTLKATYPVIVLNSNNSKWGGIGYDHTSDMVFWVNATSDDLPASGLQALNIANSGNITMGLNVPSFKLTVRGQTFFNGNLELTTDGQEVRFYRGGGVYGYVWSSSAGLHWGKGSEMNSITIDNNGNTGIGTFDPKGYKLAVAGNVIAESVKVKLKNVWPDYVFAKDYSLPTLKEIEAHIKEKGHLPGTPSAAEVKANGIDLGEMNAKLLQKIEELTLYLIGMKKENENLSKRLERLENKK